MHQDLKQVVAAANQSIGYDRLRLTWLSETRVRLETVTEVSGRPSSHALCALPEELDKALRYVARNTENYLQKRNAALSQQK